MTKINKKMPGLAYLGQLLFGLKNTPKLGLAMKRYGKVATYDDSH